MNPDLALRGSASDQSVRTIAHYTVCERLGKGAMGVVYRAIDEHTQQEVALKVLVGDLESDEETRARFFREANVAGKLRHPNVVTVLDSGEDSGRLFIAMELLTGGTLTEFLRRQEPIDLDVRVDLMLQVCHGLRAAHDRGIYHRDIKPANLFVCGDGRLKLVDFGVARLANSNMTMTGYILGTPDFMSPEQARGREVDQRSDIFSAAAVFYLMLTGRKPFAAADLPAVLNKVLRADPLPIREDEAPDALAAVIQKALSKDPGRRQQNVAQLTIELLEAAARITTDTRAAGGEARRLAEQLRDLELQRTELRTALGAPQPPASLWDSLVREHPVLWRGPVALQVFPLRGVVIDAVTRQIRPEVARLQDEVAGLRAALDSLGLARAAIDRGQESEAVAHLTAARANAPDSRVIARELESCASKVEQRRQVETLVRSRLQLAEEAMARRAWDTVLPLVAEIHAAVPGEARARQLREAALSAMEMERERQLRDRQQHAASAVVMEATALADAGGFDEAIDLLERYQKAEADAPGVAPAILDIRRAKQEAVNRLERAALVAQLVGASEQQLAAGDLAEAERLAAEAVALDREAATARVLQERVRELIRAERERHDLARRIGALLEKATRLAEQRNYAKALAAIDDALALDVTHTAAAQLQARVAAERLAFEAEQAAAAAEARRARAAGPALRAAKKAAAAGDWERARWAVDNALALAPGLAAAQALLEEIVTQTPPPRLDDGTARLTAATEDTARVAIASATLQDMAGQLRDRAQSLWRQLQSPKGQTTTEWLMVAATISLLAILLAERLPDVLVFYFRGIVDSIKGMGL